MVNIIENIDTELFINEVQTYECIWNYKSEQNKDKIKKNAAWREICEKFIADFDKKPVSEKNQIAKALQNKWKVLRDGFNRFVSKTKKVKSGSGASKMRQYVYYQQLSFLLPLSTEKAETTESLENETEEYTEEKIPKSSRKRTSVTKEDELITQLSTNINKKWKENAANTETDDTKLFLLSLYGDFNKISEEYKIDAKTEMLKVLKKYKLLSSDNNLYSSAPIQPPYSQSQFQYAHSNYDDFNSGYSTGPTYAQRTNLPETSTPTYMQRTSQLPQNNRDTQATSVLSPGSEVSQSSITSIFSECHP